MEIPTTLLPRTVITSVMTFAWNWLGTPFQAGWTDWRKLVRVFIPMNSILWSLQDLFTTLLVCCFMFLWNVLFYLYNSFKFCKCLNKVTSQTKLWKWEHNWPLAIGQNYLRGHWTTYQRFCSCAFLFRPVLACSQWCWQKTARLVVAVHEYILFIDFL